MPIFMSAEKEKFMKYFILVLIGIFVITACSEGEVPIPNERGPVPVIVSQDNPALTAYNYYGMHERYNRTELKDLTGIDPVQTEWCAAFVNSVLEESGIKSNKDHEYPLTAKAFLDWGQSVKKENIEPGDLVVFPRGDVEWQGHVGFYLSSVTKNNIEYYVILGGNQKNKVSIEFYRSSKAIDIRRTLEVN